MPEAVFALIQEGPYCVAGDDGVPSIVIHNHVCIPFQPRRGANTNEDHGRLEDVPTHTPMRIVELAPTVI